MCMCLRLQKFSFVLFKPHSTYNYYYYVAFHAISLHKKLKMRWISDGIQGKDNVLVIQY
jgi:hypothetical protein